MAARSRGNGTNFHWLRKSCDISPCDFSSDGNMEKYGRPMKSAMGPLIGLMKQPQPYMVSTLNLGKQLSVQEGIDHRLQDIQNLLVYFLSVINHLEWAYTLTGPLIRLMKQPQQYVVSSVNLSPDT